MSSPVDVAHQTYQPELVYWSETDLYGSIPLLQNFFTIYNSQPALVVSYLLWHETWSFSNSMQWISLACDLSFSTNRDDLANSASGQFFVTYLVMNCLISGLYADLSFFGGGCTCWNSFYNQTYMKSEVLEI